MSKHYLNAATLTFLLPVLLAVLSLGCGLSNLLGSSNRQLLPTRTPMPTFTPTPEGVAFVELPTLTPTTPASLDQAPAGVATTEPAEPSPTASPTSEPTETPTPVDETVTVTILQNMNVRTGPGTSYPIAGPGPAGESSRVVGRNADSSWLQVEYPSADGTGWVYASLVQVSGNPETVDVVQVAPPPQPVAAAPQAQPEEDDDDDDEDQEEAPPPAPKYQFTPTGWHASENAAIVHFKGRIRDEGGNLVNGYSVRVNNGAFSIISHPTGASHWYPAKGDGEWDVSGVPLKDAIGWWWLSVVRYECAGFFEAGFDSQCKQFTTLSEEVKIQVVYPNETIINADWVCHWDCDKGLYSQAFRP